MNRTFLRAAVAAALMLVAGVSPAHAVLGTSGFRAVAVAHASYPVSAMAVAPDGRLFMAVQALGQTTGTTPGRAEIRVYSAYARNDGAVFDEGTVWATLENVRATTNEEGLLGLALAPDFATSKLIYVYLTTTDESVNQHIRVYKENVAGVGEYLGTVATTLEPPTEQTTRNGGPLVFGVDGCLYAGVGDNGSGSRWNAQLLQGTEAISGTENANNGFCGNVCLGSTSYPDRMVTSTDALNYAGKILRFAVEGASAAGPATDFPLAAQPFVYGTGVRSPAALAVHPLTGQLWTSERGDGQEAELDVVDRGSNLGWPCLEGGLNGTLGCLSGHMPDEVYGHHPDWRRPLVRHATSPAVTGIVGYSGRGYPAAYYGDVFYLLRDSDRIYRIDLDAPCFLPHPNGVTSTAFHDSATDGDFTAVYDINNDGQPDNVTFPNLMALVEGLDPLGQQVLYVAGKQGNGNGLTDDSVIFRIEFATAFVPYDGPGGRVADSCFTSGTYSGGGPGGTPVYGWDNPFANARCLPPGGPCPGQPDGTSCDDGDPCNGAEACQAGICRPGVAAADGTQCQASDVCHAAGSCQSGQCVAGPALADGTPCPDGDPCSGERICQAGVCQVGTGPARLEVGALVMKRAGKHPLSLRGSIRPTVQLAPDNTDTFIFEIVDNTGVVLSSTLDHPGSDPFWRRRGRNVTYTDRRGRVGGVTAVELQRAGSGMTRVAFNMRGGALTPDPATTSARLRVGASCFVADLSAGRCRLDAKKLRCR